MEGAPGGRFTESMAKQQQDNTMLQCPKGQASVLLVTSEPLKYYAQ